VTNWIAPMPFGKRRTFEPEKKLVLHTKIYQIGQVSP